MGDESTSYRSAELIKEIFQPCHVNKAERLGREEPYVLEVYLMAKLIIQPNRNVLGASHRIKAEHVTATPNGIQSIAVLLLLTLLRLRIFSFEAAI